jgi:hypothetical protein
MFGVQGGAASRPTNGRAAANGNHTVESVSSSSSAVAGPSAGSSSQRPSWMRPLQYMVMLLYVFLYGYLLAMTVPIRRSGECPNPSNVIGKKSSVCFLSRPSVS